MPRDEPENPPSGTENQGALGPFWDLSFVFDYNSPFFKLFKIWGHCTFGGADGYGDVRRSIVLYIGNDVW